MKKNFSTCPVCGYDHLAEPPRNRAGDASMETCPSCGFQFGVTDDKQGVNYDDHRSEWIAKGMQWFSQHKKTPRNWNPNTQLGSLALRATLSRVKGRPPRIILGDAQLA